jgi:hypothetical protein
VLSRRISICVVCLCIIISSGCDYLRPISFTAVAKERAILWGDIESYQSIGEFGAYVQKRGYEWKTLMKSGLDTRGVRPPYVIHSVVVERYTLKSIRGRLVAVFFNDRLMRLIFVPEDIEACAKVLLGCAWQTIPKEGLVISPHVRARVLAGEVILSDMRLEEEQRIWISRYS